MDEPSPISVLNIRWKSLTADFLACIVVLELHADQVNHSYVALFVQDYRTEYW